MGMGYGANRAWVITEDKLGTLNLPSWNTFQEKLHSVDNLREVVEGLIFDYTYKELSIEIEPADYAELQVLWCSLQEEFKMRTNLELDLYYHNSEDESSRYDDVDGIFYTVGNVESFTLAGAKAFNSKLIDVAWWVSYG